MSSEWISMPASEFCLSVRDGTHDSPKEVLSGGKNLVTSRHIKGGLLDLSTSYKISGSDYEEINKRSKVDQGYPLFNDWHGWRGSARQGTPRLRH
jgi:type I restriction enzyme, S subunit